MKKIILKEEDIDNLLCELFNVNNLEYLRNPETWTNKLEKSFGIDYNGFVKLIKKLILFTPITESPGGHKQHAFIVEYPSTSHTLMSISVETNKPIPV